MSLPSSLDYTKILPIAAGNPRAMRRTFLPMNGQSFTAAGNNIVRIEISASQFWDPLHSYLRFDVTNGAQTCGLDYGAGHGFIRRLRVEQAGSIIMDCNRYDRLLAAILLPAQGGSANQAQRSITENIVFGNNTNLANGNTSVPVANAAVSGAFTTATAPSNNFLAANATTSFSIPLVGGLFSQDKLVPLQLLSSSPLTIELELSPSVDAMIAAAGGNADYTMSNIRYIAQLVDVSPEVDAQVRMVQEMSGGHIVLNSTDYTHFSGNISANATGSQAINVPARRKSMKSILFCGASQQGATVANFRQSFGGNFGLTSYHAKIGSINHPATPIDCRFTAAGPGGASLNGRGEALMELSKCFGTTGSVIGTGVLNRMNCYRTSGAVASGQIANANPFLFSPFGLDLEAFQRTAIESGINTADRSTPITLILDIGTGINEAQTVDAFVSFDSLYYIDSSGIISVSH
tara:strand:+ start:183 stop:1571 length:1389 start_codon:yes stop_codon:yes gene_type:complete